MAPVSDAPLEGTLEQLVNKASLGKWDQFKVNEEKFGVFSTFKADLSQYTTILDKKKITREMKERAERIAHELEKGGASVRDEEYDDGDADEEDLFSAVQRGPGGTAAARPTAAPAAPGRAAAAAPGDGSDDAGRALLASLRGAPGAAPRSAEGDHRALVAPKVRDYWRARRLAGGCVPQGAEAALVCPFSNRVLGDVSQLVTHWAGALPRAVDPQGSTETPSLAASQHFGRLGQELRWSQIAAAGSGLDAALPISSPRPGSVWEQILTRVASAVAGDGGANGSSVAERPVAEFIVEAVRLRCWRREQKIEHREVMEGIAAGLALYALSHSPNVAWDSLVEDGASGGALAPGAGERAVGMCH